MQITVDILSINHYSSNHCRQSYFPVFILVFPLARSSPLFLLCFSTSVFLFLLFDVGNDGAFFSFFVVAVLRRCSQLEFESIWPGESIHSAWMGRGLPAVYAREWLNGPTHSWPVSYSTVISYWNFFANITKKQLQTTSLKQGIQFKHCTTLKVVLRWGLAALLSWKEKTRSYASDCVSRHIIKNWKEWFTEPTPVSDAKSCQKSVGCFQTGFTLKTMLWG